MAALDPIAIRLHQALQGNALPPEGQSIGHRLLSQLNQPTRVAVVGLAGSGKTSLVNMLLGAPLMPDLDGPLAAELAFGDVARSQIILADGTRQSRTGLVPPSSLPAGAVQVLMELPDPRLKEWSFLEITLSSAGPQHGALLEWMTQRSDIAIWCSQTFDDRERGLWAQVPDHLKDHSFLALTRADRMLMKGELTDRIAWLQPIMADEFLGLYPIATLQASAARMAANAQTDLLWQSSGAKAFVEAIQRQVDQARTANLDHAYILLERYKAALADPGRLVGNAPAAVVPAPAATPRVAPLATPRKADPKIVLREALAILQGCAEDLIAARDTGKGASADRILDRCATAADALVQLLSRTDGSDPEIEALTDDAIEGEQMLMLLRLERGETAAEDSLTVLLQIKKEMSERVAT